MARGFWSEMCGAFGVMAAFPVAVAKGTYDAVNGKPFVKGMTEVLDPVLTKCEDFGERNKDSFTVGTIVSGLTYVFTTAFTKPADENAKSTDSTSSNKP